jgi:hypothetical protein
MMNDDIEQLLGQLTPRGVRPELRPQILAAVAGELQAEPASPWLRRSALAVAASLLLGIAMNIWANAVADRRLARLFGPPPVARRALDTQPQFAGSRPSGGVDALAGHYALLQELINELETVSKGSFHEAPQKDPPMDRGGPGRAGGNRSGCQRLFRMDYRYTA